ncbi:hypothetical protein O9A_00064 [Bartonella koehlerae C-29]|uniref:Uncharacterized protein n=1 Tax=Bartonella koehlerae C-29 TaxID=1134510 RepID=A0A067W991_9HYPH|nr:hypothetical protein O9A_00064 [Bartonella koehlerae C-29]
MLFSRNYVIIFCISLILLVLTAFIRTEFFLCLMDGIRLDGFIPTMFLLSIAVWACLVIFLPVTLLFHIILNYKLKKMIQKMENQRRSATNQSLYKV